MQTIRKQSVSLPDFMIIGAMKCATSTLHDQLALQTDFFMSDPKEPNYFSDDDVYARGISWYGGLFSEAKAGQIKGESSTHYTKLPTYPKTLERIMLCVPRVKFIYVMRHPVDRLVSHYIHEWTQGVISCGIDNAIHTFPELVHYSCYNMQLESYLKQFSSSNVLPLFAERLRCNPVLELQTVFNFLDVSAAPVWHTNIISNVSAKRMRRCAWRDSILVNPVVRILRRTLVPQKVRTKIRNLWTIQKRPILSYDSLQYVEGIFDKDLGELGRKLDLNLNCKNFKKTVVSPENISWLGL